MQLYKVRNLKATTIRNYEDDFRRTEEYIGYMKLVDVTPHSFRHTFVTRCVQSGMKSAAVGKINGHSTQKMTEYYTQLEQGYVKDEYKQYDEKYGKES